MTIDIYPSLHFLPRPGLTPQALSFSRSGVATRIDPRGRVEVVSADTLRHDFDPVSGAYRGWLIEEPRTNLLLQSRDVSQAIWIKSGLTAARSGKGRDGGAATASVLTATAANATALQAVTSASATHCFSLDLRRNVGTGRVFVTLDGGASWDEVSALLALGNWIRASTTKTLANPSVGVRIETAGDAVMVDYAQLEVGTFATSRIPTDTSPVSRGGDLAATDTGIGGWFNPDEGTVYVEASFYGTDAAVTKNIFSSSATPDGLDVGVGAPTQGIATNIGVLGSGFSGGSPSALAVTTDVPFRLALSYGPSGGAVVQNGQVFQQYSVGTPWDTARLAFGVQLRNGPTRWLNGHIRHVAVFPRRLSPTQAQELTTL